MNTEDEIKKLKKQVEELTKLVKLNQLNGVLRTQLSTAPDTVTLNTLNKEMFLYYVIDPIGTGEDYVNVPQYLTPNSLVLNNQGLISYIRIGADNVTKELVVFNGTPGAQVFCVVFKHSNLGIYL